MELLLIIYIFWWFITRLLLIVDFNDYMIKHELEFNPFAIGFMLAAILPPVIGEAVLLSKLLATK